MEMVSKFYDKLLARQSLSSWFCVILGSVILSAGFVLFMNPYRVVPGGVYGTGIVLHALVPSVQVGTFGLMLDIPLLLIGLKVFGRMFGVKTVCSALLIPVVMNGMTYLIGENPATMFGGNMNLSQDMFLVCIFGGVFLGCGTGLIIKGHATSGGTDIIAMLLTRYTRMRFSRAILLVDSCIIVFGMVVLGDWRLPLYSLITIFVSSRIIDYIIDGGVDFIVALGTTAETPTLYLHERAVVAMFIKNHIAGRVPLVIGVGGNSTSEVLDQLREFDLRGADAILSVTPYYNKPSQEGLYQHFKTVSEHSPLPIILYNVPGRTGVNMTAATTIRIAGDFPNVIGIKEASGKIDQIQEILDWRSRDFLVLSGDDALTLDLMSRGADGVISVAVNAFPRKMMTCIDLAKKGDFEGAHKAYECLEEAVTALFAEGNPTGVKCAMSVLGLIGNTLRLPLVPGTPQLEARFKELIAKYDLN